MRLMNFKFWQKPIVKITRTTLLNLKVYKNKNQSVNKMDKKDFNQLTDEKLLLEKKKLKKSKILHASLIGFLAGVLLFGIVAWSLNPEKRLGFFIPMIFPVWFIYKVIKNSKNNRVLEEVLRRRGLN